VAVKRRLQLRAAMHLRRRCVAAISQMQAANRRLHLQFSLKI
jgi:hypothetical protein